MPAAPAPAAAAAAADDDDEEDTSSVSSTASAAAFLATGSRAALTAFLPPAVALALAPLLALAMALLSALALLPLSVCGGGLPRYTWRLRSHSRCARGSMPGLRWHEGESMRR